MDKLITIIGGAVMTLAAIAVLPIFSALFGAVAGFITGLFFEEAILGFLGKLGVTGVTMWQFGAFMGFAGGFLKTKVTVTEK